MTEFRTSSFCASSSCVSVGVTEALDPDVLVRDTKDSNRRRYLRFTLPEWRDFVAGVKAGEFDV